MRQYELAIRIAQIHHLLDEHKYKKALSVVRTLDMKQIKSLVISVLLQMFLLKQNNMIQQKQLI